MPGRCLLVDGNITLSVHVQRQSYLVTYAIYAESKVDLRTTVTHSIDRIDRTAHAFSMQGLTNVLRSMRYGLWGYM
jgi:hypothetical protein